MYILYRSIGSYYLDFTLSSYIPGYTVDPDGVSLLEQPKSNRAPTDGNDLVNKTYVDSLTSGPTCSFGSTGYCHWPNGYIKQWTRTSAIGNKQSVWFSWPLAFTSVYGANATPYYGAYNENLDNVVQITSLSNTSGRISSNDVGSGATYSTIYVYGWGYRTP